MLKFLVNIPIGNYKEDAMKKYIVTILGCIFTIMLGLSIIFSRINKETCPELNYEDFKYGDSVKVLSGFYKGQIGMILKRGFFVIRQIEDPDFCQVPAYTIIFNEIDVIIEQDNLQKVGEEDE